MAIVFQTVFNEGNWGVWDVTNNARSAPFPSLGISGGACNTCNSGTGGTSGVNSKYVGTPVILSPPSAGTGLAAFAIRIQYAILATADYGTDIPYISYFQHQVTGGDPSGLISGSIGIKYNGTIRVNWGNGDGFNSTNYDSASGLFPVDGTNHAIQLVVTNNVNSIDFQVLLDNVSVLTGNHPYGGECGSWGTYSASPHCAHWISSNLISIAGLLHNRNPTNTTINATWMTRCCEFIIDDSAAAITYNAASVSTLAINSCTASPPVDGTLTVGKLTYPLDNTTEFEVVIGDGTVPPLN